MPTILPNFEPMVYEPFNKKGKLPLLPIQEEILELKKQRNAVILAHNYQIPAIQDIADYVGDSLGLSYKAAETKADVIAFCGVHFMAETAKIINPTKTVVIPDLEAGCSLSDSCPAEKLAAFKAANPDIFIVAYINCSAAVKALVDIICTSSNAIKIVEKIPQNKKILFVPDQNLGQWVSQKTGREMLLWPGSCYVHVLFTARTLEKMRQQFPGAPVVAHPECIQSVRDMADIVCSTEKMVSFVRENPADTFIIATEAGIIHRLRKEVPNKTFVAGPAQHCACNECRFMKLNTLEKLRDCLKNLSSEVTLDPTIQKRAYEPIKKMLEWSK